MSEHYTSTSRQVLKECTRDWRETPTDPTDAYHQFRVRMGEKASLYSTYLSTAITAGGYRRDSTLTSQEIAHKNSLVAFEYADALQDEALVDLEYSVDAVSLGYIPKWNQSDYLEFWFHVMARPDLTPRDQAHYTYRKANHTSVDFDTFNDSSLPNSERRPEYLAYVDQYLQCIDHVSKQPIERAVQLIDRKLSLGGDAEARLAHKIGAKVCAPALVNYATDPSMYPWKNFWLAQHLNELSSLGATTLEPARQRLVLFEDRPLDQ